MSARKQAEKEGKKRYFTGFPCKHGHLAERYTNNGACVVCHANSMSDAKVKRQHTVVTEVFQVPNGRVDEFLEIAQSLLDEGESYAID